MSRATFVILHVLRAMIFAGLLFWLARPADAVPARFFGIEENPLAPISCLPNLLVIPPDPRLDLRMQIADRWRSRGDVVILETPDNGLWMLYCSDMPKPEAPRNLDAPKRTVGLRLRWLFGQPMPAVLFTAGRRPLAAALPDDVHVCVKRRHRR